MLALLCRHDDEKYDIQFKQMCVIVGKKLLINDVGDVKIFSLEDSFKKTSTRTCLLFRALESEELTLIIV